MPPLTRQRTPQSLYSEWSHSYLGATISIHALAKPLMKFMYHRAVLDLIKQQQGIPLSGETIQIYESYLMSKYVAETTKALILRELEYRARVEVEAQLVADFLVLYDILLDSPGVMVRSWTCWALGQLALHSSTRAVVVAVQPGAALVALLSDANVNIVRGACFAVSHICRDLGGAIPIVAAGALEFLKQLLQSQDTDVRWHACWALGQLAYHSPTQAAVVAVQPGAQLVALLSDRNIKVVKGACYALSQISRELDGAKAAVEAGALEIIQQLLKSQDTEVRRWTAWFFAEVASHSLTRQGVVTVQPCAQLVVLLGDGDVDVVTGACCALYQVCREVDGARAAVEAGVLKTVKQLLESHNEGVRTHACSALGRLASHSSTRAAVVAVQLGAHLITLLSDANVNVIRGACYAG
ncbi:armadillo-type protein [Mycena metata]|uniref:Armadillo-type protein n=1 Tax=Mycena metata TaxID=1033252 RepID=A0AAD7HZ23_9AGAR|nr:armadillo-type protein [Mycena metata]